MISRRIPQVRHLGEGPPILTVHGGPGMSYSYFFPGLNGITEHYRVLYYEQLPPRGKKSPGVTAADQVGELVDVISTISDSHGSVRLLAHSWGTYLALEALKETSTAVSHVVFINAIGLTWDRFVAAGGRLVDRVNPEDLPIVEALEAEGSEESGVALMERVGYAYLSPANAGMPLPHFDRYSPAINATIVASIEGFDHRSAYDWTCNTEIRYVWGADDYLSAADCAELAVHGESFVIDGCGHFPFDEQPDALTAVLLSALR